MAAYNLEIGGLVIVTAVLRSNFKAVSENGFTITSVDHGDIKGWKPTNSKYFLLSKSSGTVLTSNHSHQCSAYSWQG